VYSSGQSEHWGNRGQNLSISPLRFLWYTRKMRDLHFSACMDGWRWPTTFNKMHSKFTEHSGHLIIIYTEKNVQNQKKIQEMHEMFFFKLQINSSSLESSI